MPLESSFEILALKGGRWEVCHVAHSHGAAMSIAAEIGERPDLSGIRVVREVFDPKTGLSHGHVLFENIKNARKSGQRVGSR